MSQFKKVFSIQLKHLYYGIDQTKFINDFDIVPTEDTEIALKNQGMIWKQTTDSLVVLGNSVPDGDDFQLFKPVGANTRFRFYLKLKTKTFHNFTDIPFSGNEGTIYYFNNRSTFIPDSGDLADNLLLFDDGHDGNYVNGNERMAVLPELFTITLPTSAPHVKLEDVYDSSNVPFDSGTTSLSGSIQFDLRGKVKAGRYQLTQDGTPVGDNFYIDPQTRDVFGVIELFEVSTENEDYEYVDVDGVIKNPVYVIPFKNRSTTWKYYLHINDTTLIPTPPDPSLLRIDATDVGSPIVFTGAPSGSGADVVFTSDDPIPLQYNTYKNIVLYKLVSTDDGTYTSGTDIPVLLNMPNPSIEIVKPIGSDVFSEIFVYV
ncbi:MAG TPA: hypothetical protein VNB90_01880 [Cytophagaceae bacterium]|nr:hypothetical protein [Cytophagaceae bacterium]